jgi:uncharacterized protein (TIGR03435 family)
MNAARVAGFLAIALLSRPEVKGQPAAALPEFDAASIRPSDRGAAMGMLLKPGSLMSTNQTLVEYIYTAYGIQPYQLDHAPTVSLDDLSARYDIAAKAAEAVPAPQVRLMLQSLLADRFKLAVHRESKELSAYILTVDKGGLRMKASQDEGPTTVALKESAMEYKRASMEYLTRMLSSFPSLGRPVVDRTGLDGIYDFALTRFAPEGPNGNVHQQLDDGLNASLKAMGLKLESQKTSIEVLVIDSLAKPSPN